jgi:hypothetical protein
MRAEPLKTLLSKHFDSTTIQCGPLFGISRLDVEGRELCCTPSLCKLAYSPGSRPKMPINRRHRRPDFVVPLQSDPKDERRGTRPLALNSEWARQCQRARLSSVRCLPVAGAMLGQTVE